ncbi:MAG: DinB family protein [Gemmatimonadaceae bacterium]
MEIRTLSTFLDYLGSTHTRTRRVLQRAIFSALTDEQLNGRCTTPACTPITTWKWLRAMFEHEAHHRGQIYLMLGIRGVQTPPIFGLTSEEVAARSAR